MNSSRSRSLLTAAAIGVVAVLASGCVVPGGYGYDDGAAYGLDYYEPYGGVAVGGWGYEYQVAPYREGGHYPAAGGGARAHAFRAAPASRPMPSIPSGSRSGGGGRGGGSGGGRGERR